MGDHPHDKIKFYFWVTIYYKYHGLRYETLDKKFAIVHYIGDTHVLSSDIKQSSEFRIRVDIDPIRIKNMKKQIT